MDTIYQHAPLAILESRLDWVSVTVKPGQRQTVVKGRVAAWIDAQVSEGNDRRTFVTPFYVGVRTRGIAFGERKDDCLITLSGAMAHAHGPTLITWADNISRLDVQLTLIEPNLETNWASYVDRLYSLDPRVQAGALTTRLYTQRPRGITSYIGDGASDKLCRVYDKAAESNDLYPLGSWRWEIQYRHKRALSVAQHLLNESFLPASVLKAVCGGFLDYHVDVPTVCMSREWRDNGPGSQTDDLRRLDWLRRSVAPCVERLTEHYGFDTVLNAMGMESVVNALQEQSDEIKALGETVAQQIEAADVLATRGLVLLQ